ncbi:MAG TPA: LacI family DNA-binding transcriptional regulator [Jatrophihabitans sp.]|jgi:DNA-binding LacI/PurR family transcriptional regulator|uniref:LacI family DNA-binding transcriptional regulator n=1 Tax=Jatrophihabitans sp. TaxID=1932789 RepID=UPI002DF9F108|nr:LacI family DNA-binding transcriptional regulator [Jatrophihabitans sp.]
MTVSPPEPRPTLEVVAARAGVSRATASRVLRGAANVSPRARDAVLAAAAELSYSVNHAARSLVTRRSDSIAFLVAENEDRMFHDPYFLGVLRGAQGEAARCGVQLVFAIAATAAERRQFVQFVGSGHVDGVLLVSLHGDDSLARDLEGLGVPTVLNGRPFAAETDLFSVDSDNVGGARIATARLIDRGCRAIATITGPLDMSAGRDRLAGFRAALGSAGLDPDGPPLAEGDFTLDGGAAAMEMLLREHPELDAVFVASDLMALGALRTLAEHGRRVPEDVAVIGFDDVREAQLAAPALSTVRQPLDELGRTMTRVLLARTGAVDAGPGPRQRTVLATELVLRQTA